MRWYDREPTLEEILSDPIFKALMKADRIEPHELQSMLTHVAAVSRSVREIDTKPSDRRTVPAIPVIGTRCGARSIIASPLI
jgi:hypothetical protein